MLFVSYDLVSAFGENSLLLQKLTDKIASAVSGGIINHHNVEVGVVLHDDRTDVAQIAFVLFIVEGGHHHTKWQLFVHTHAIFELVVVVLLLCSLAERG